MAIKKIVTYEIQCNGPCGKMFKVQGRIPPMISHIKVEPASKPIGEPLEYLVGTLCNECSIAAVVLLKNNGFKLQSANERKKEGQS